MITLVSSHGELHFNMKGEIVADNCRTEDGWPMQNHPCRLDLAEYKHTYGEDVTIEGSHDILDWGYWTNGGGYEPPVHEWREEIRKERRKRG